MNNLSLLPLRVRCESMGFADLNAFKGNVIQFSETEINGYEEGTPDRMGAVQRRDEVLEVIETVINSKTADFLFND